MIVLAPNVRDVVVGCYAKTGQWPETWHLIARGEAVPPYLQQLADRARVAFLTENPELRSV